MQTDINVKGNRTPDGQVFNYFNISVVQVSVSAPVAIEDGCAGFMLTNIGDTIVRVNGMTLFPSATPATALGDSITIGLHKNDLYAGRLDVSFNPGGVTPLLQIVQIHYMQNYRKTF